MGTYRVEELVQTAKRDNNKKRPYLLVNPLQGKHIPVSPKKAMEVFTELAGLLSSAYGGERLLIIGFAETATAIGAAAAVRCPEAVYYLHTTRECVKGAEKYLYFSEVHSHATEQKLIADRFDQVIDQTDRIVFAEDEVTTGNTILNLIREIKERYPQKKNLSFGILSILNSMTDQVLEEFLERGIRCLYLSRIENRDFAAELEDYRYEPELLREGENQVSSQTCVGIRNLCIPGKQEPRLGVNPDVYQNACESLAKACKKALLQGEGELAETGSLAGKRILVLGTEEFMYPALLAALRIEESENCLVRFHATTRSPILPSSEAAYPLHIRYELRSVYEAQRITYIYNLESYDYVIWIHDAVDVSAEGIKSLTAALGQAGCQKIIVCRWDTCESEEVIL